MDGEWLVVAVVVDGEMAVGGDEIDNSNPICKRLCMYV
jgi:hypothetical protein